MTSVLEKPRSRGTGAAAATSRPQVNLLPPEIRAARGLRAVKRYLALVIVVVVLACVGAWVFARLDQSSAASDLAKAQSDTLRLQKDESKYADVPKVLTQLNAAKAARSAGMATEVLWNPYYQAITAVLPAGVSLDSITVTSATPLVAPAPAGSPLQAPSVGQIQFTARSMTLPDTAAWVDSLDSIPGLGDAWVSSAAIQATGESKVAYYTIAATVQVRNLAYAHRFDTISGAN